MGTRVPNFISLWGPGVPKRGGPHLYMTPVRGFSGAVLRVIDIAWVWLVASLYACAKDTPPGQQFCANREKTPLVYPGCGRWGITLIGALYPDSWSTGNPYIYLIIRKGTNRTRTTTVTDGGITLRTVFLALVLY
jgi:hypothetical protein